MDQPPPAPEGEGSERVFGVEVTKYRCKNGYMWENGKWPYLEMECLNRKWSPKTLPECIPRSCGLTIPTAYMGMEIAWPYKKRELRLDNIHLPKSDHHLGGDAGGPG